MFLKNYTSNVPVTKTINRIEQVLIKCGVSGITKEYGPAGEIVAVRFEIKPGADVPLMTVRLPADKQKARDAMWLDYADGEKLSPNGDAIVQWPSRKRKNRKDFSQQAERTAWKLIQDWVEVQMSLILMGQAEYPEVFMPYIYDQRSRTTLYQRVKEAGYRAMLPEKCE